MLLSLRNRCICQGLLCLFSVAFLAVEARAQHSDIEIEVEGGRLVTEPRVGEAEFGEAPNPANLADEPGFEVDDGIFQPNEILGFDIVGFDLGGGERHLWYWDGTGAPSFGPSPHALTLESPVTSLNLTIDSNGSGLLAGFPIDQADADGGVHSHLDFILDGATPADGVYAWAMQMTSPNYLTSEPVFLVIASNVDETVHEMAIDFVTTTMGVPEPSGAILGLGMLLACFARYRRR